MKNIFLEKSYIKCCGKSNPRPFCKKSKLSILKFVFTACQVEDYRKILKLSCRPLTFTSHKAFLETKNRSGTSLLASVSAYFLKKKKKKKKKKNKNISRDIGQY